ncbi:hypothetical protein ACOME3_007954 [Neoechinorhynchus agilis]
MRQVENSWTSIKCNMKAPFRFARNLCSIQFSGRITCRCICTRPESVPTFDSIDFDYVDLVESLKKIRTGRKTDNSRKKILGENSTDLLRTLNKREILAFRRHTIGDVSVIPEKKSMGDELKTLVQVCLLKSKARQANRHLRRFAIDQGALNALNELLLFYSNDPCDGQENLHRIVSLFRFMKKQNIDPDRVSYAAALCSLSRCMAAAKNTGDLSGMMKLLLAELKSKGFNLQKDIYSLTNILTVEQIHGIRNMFMVVGSDDNSIYLTNGSNEPVDDDSFHSQSTKQFM